MRIDDDVLLLEPVAYDPFQLMYQTGAVYAYGCTHVEKHQVTVQTLVPWVYKYCHDMETPEQEESCRRIAIEIGSRMYFNNLFATRLKFWHSDAVQQFMREVDRFGGIYSLRWGDAPIQSAALSLFAPVGGILLLPLLVYVHNSGSNFVMDGHVTDSLQTSVPQNFFTAKENRIPGHRQRFQSSPKSSKLPMLGSVTFGNEEGEHRRRRTFLDGHAGQVCKAHIPTWRADLTALRRTYLRNGNNITMSDITILCFALRIGVWCDGAGMIQNIWLMPRTCCCHLDTFRTERVERDTSERAAIEASQTFIEAEELLKETASSSYFGGSLPVTADKPLWDTPDRQILEQLRLTDTMESLVRGNMATSKKAHAGLDWYVRDPR